jgi:hypothetical protein
MPKIPAPFQRESTDLTRHGKKWQTVKAIYLRTDDILAGDSEAYPGGRVGRPTHSQPGDPSVGFWINGTLVWFDPEEEVFLFGPPRD